MNFFLKQKATLALYENRKTNMFLYWLLRFYFIFFPLSPLIVKIGGYVYWKDIAYILCFIFGIKYIYKIKFIFQYLLIVFVIELLQLVQFNFYVEYITWFIMGLPIVMYFQQIKIKDFDNDLYLIGILMIGAFLWVYFLESKGGYEYTFIKESENYSAVRGNTIRMRFCFVSPMAFSQYLWFSLICITQNPRLNKWFKRLFTLTCAYTIIYCNTRAGLLLSSISLAVFLYTIYFTLNLWKTVGIISVSIFLLVLQMVLSAQDFNSATSWSDAERLALISKGIESIKNNFLLGVGGEYFSVRSGKGTIFESTWLPLINSFGFMGVLLSVFLFAKLLKGSDKRHIGLFSISWLIYSFIFPGLQETAALYITWFILSIIILEKKSSLLFSAQV